MGGLMGLLGLGNKAKSESKSETNIVNESVFSSISKSENAVSASVLTVQDMSVSGITAYCDLDVSQKINADIKVLQQFDEKSTTDLVNSITADLDKKAKSMTSQESGFGGLIPNQSEKVDNVMTNIKNKISKSITAETLNTLAAKVVSEQKLKTENLVIDPVGMTIYKQIGVPPPLELAQLAAATECSIGQDAQIRFVAEQIGSKISEIISKDEANIKLAEEIENAQSQKSQGIGGAYGEAAEGLGKGVSTAVKGAGDGISTAAKGVGDSVSSVLVSLVKPLIIGAVILAFLLIGYYMFNKSKKNQATGYQT